jgi:hypothetical protein
MYFKDLINEILKPVCLKKLKSFMFSREKDAEIGIYYFINERKIYAFTFILNHISFSALKIQKSIVHPKFRNLFRNPNNVELLTFLIFNE